MNIKKEWQFYSRALVELGEYAEKRLIPRLHALGSLPARQDALRLIYYCARSVLEPLIESRRPAAFRGHAVLCRTLWEHWVDFETIRRATDDEGRRFLAFAEIQPWNYFQRIRQIRDELGVDSGGLPIDRPGVEDRVRQLARDHYGAPLADVRSITSWDRRGLFDRAQALGDEHALYYREFYSFLCWSSHGSATAVAGMDAHFLDRQAAQWRFDGFDHYLKMTQALIDEFGWERDETAELERIVEIAVGDYEGPTEER